MLLLFRYGMLSPTKKLYKLYLQHQTEPSQLNIWLSVLHMRGSVRGRELSWMIFQPCLFFHSSLQVHPVNTQETKCKCHVDSSLHFNVILIWSNLLERFHTDMMPSFASQDVNLIRQGWVTPTNNKGKNIYNVMT